jgi:hypothetical protein
MAFGRVFGTKQYSTYQLQAYNDVFPPKSWFGFEKCDFLGADRKRKMYRNTDNSVATHLRNIRNHAPRSPVALIIKRGTDTVYYGRTKRGWTTESPEPCIPGNGGNIRALTSVECRKVPRTQDAGHGVGTGA